MTLGFLHKDNQFYSFGDGKYNFILQNKLGSTTLRNYIGDLKEYEIEFYNNDFYSISMARDLMFHVQEHCFTIPEISNMLKKLNLEFLGFRNPLIKTKFSKSFPNDEKNISLDNWNKFELNNQDVFANMYQF